MPLIHSIHRGKAEPLPGTDRWSAIRKEPIVGPAAVGALGFIGDIQVDTRYHGGEFKALCAYATTYYEDWKSELGLTMPYGAFGENLAIDGIRDEDVCVGDVYTVGDEVRLRVTGPRAPCGSLSAHWGKNDFHVIVKRKRRTGFYLSVLAPGRISAGDAFSLTDRPAPEWNILAFWEAFDKDADPDVRQRIVQVIKGIDPDWARRAAKSAA